MKRHSTSNTYCRLIAGNIERRLSIIYQAVKRIGKPSKNKLFTGCAHTSQKISWIVPSHSGMIYTRQRYTYNGSSNKKKKERSTCAITIATSQFVAALFIASPGKQFFFFFFQLLRFNGVTSFSQQLCC